jgi:H/ACA ribonucleoprotein complex subunit 4
MNHLFCAFMGQLPFEKRPVQVQNRMESQTDPKLGVDPNNRSISELIDRGIVVVDKPAGPTSHQVSAYVQQILKIKKSGHSGTLDPQVTGVLPVALGKGTRIVQSLLTAGKEYVCLMHVHAPFDEEQLRTIIKDQFIGKIKQLPPIKSAVKRRWRFRKIYYLDIIEIKGQDVLFVVGCQAGTYIRKLCHDIGEALGSGAHMAELRRSKAASFVEAESCSLQDLIDALHYYKKEGDESHLRKLILPIESGVRHLAKIWIQDSAVRALCNGLQLKLPGIVKVDSEIQVGDTVAVMTLKNELVLVGESLMTSRELLGEKGIAVKTQQVFMPPDVYPRMDK